MIKHSTHSDLLPKLLELLDKHRSAFRQERSYWRVVGLVLGELFNFGRHTDTQGLMALGLTDDDWSGCYRLFSRQRYVEARVARLFFRETLPHTSPDEPYVVGVDGVQIPRSSLKMLYLCARINTNLLKISGGADFESRPNFIAGSMPVSGAVPGSIWRARGTDNRKI